MTNLRFDVHAERFSPHGLTQTLLVHWGQPEEVEPKGVVHYTRCSPDNVIPFDLAVLWGIPDHTLKLRDVPGLPANGYNLLFVQAVHLWGQRGPRGAQHVLTSLVYANSGVHPTAVVLEPRPLLTSLDGAPTPVLPEGLTYEQGAKKLQQYWSTLGFTQRTSGAGVGWMTRWHGTSRTVGEYV